MKLIIDIDKEDFEIIKYNIAIDNPLCPISQKEMVAKIANGTPQKHGKWIIIDNCEQFIAKCSECGETVDSRMISKYPYCHCGVKNARK